MSLKIIGVGFGRTGTLSVYTALNELGYPCYHMFEVIENKANKTHLDFWNRVANSPEGSKHDWNEVFQNYTATVDNPGCCVWRELLEFYPEAKVILTLHPRGPEAWYESTIDTIYFSERQWQFRFLKLIVPFARKMGNMTSKLVWQRSHKGTMENKSSAIARYQEHIAEIKSAVPPEKLLIFTVSEGWEPLCNFLGVEPPQKDFPNVNDRAEFKKNISKMFRGAYILLVILGLALAGLIFLIIKFFV